jgi:hypothetical protein
MYRMDSYVICPVPICHPVVLFSIFLPHPIQPLFLEISFYSYLISILKHTFCPAYPSSILGKLTACLIRSFFHSFIHSFATQCAYFTVILKHQLMFSVFLFFLLLFYFILFFYYLFFSFYYDYIYQNTIFVGVIMK